MGGIWSQAELAAWLPPEKLTPSQWAEQYRMLLPPAAEPGDYRFSRTPYMRGIHDAITEDGVEELVFLKPTRVGWTITTQNLLGYWIDRDSGPCLLVMPSEDAAHEMMQNSIIPLVEQTPILRQHVKAKTNDVTKTKVNFDSMSLQIGWAGSPQSLASKEIRYVVLDEVDKYPAFSGREADPINLARERTKTYGHRKRILIGSTPTTREGAIWRAWEDCGDQRHYHVPCPHCGHYQRLVYTQIKKPALEIKDRIRLADALQLGQLCWYECVECRGKIIESHKPAMLARGVWLSESQSIDKAGVITGQRPKTKRTGFRLNTIYSPWTSFSDIMAEAIRAEGDRGRMMNFRNSWLAEPFEEQIASVKVGTIRDRRADAPMPLIVPRWAGRLITTVDVQLSRFYWVIRAWGAGYRSQLVHFGTAFNFDELRQIGLNTAYRMGGEGGDVMLPHLLLIDCGYRRDEVIAFAQSDSRVIPIKGASKKPLSPVWWSKAFSQYGLRLAIIDTEEFKDRLAGWISDKDKWMVNRAITDEYAMHLASEHKVIIRKRGRVEYRWLPVSEGAANHYLDCEVYQAVGADICQVGVMPDEAALEAQRQQAKQVQTQQQRKQSPNLLGSSMQNYWG